MSKDLARRGIAQCRAFVPAALPRAAHIALQFHEVSLRSGGGSGGTQACTASASAPRKARRPLLDEGSHALGVVGGFSQLPLGIALDVELLGERALPAAANGGLGPGQSAGGCLRQLPRQRIDRAREFG